MTTTKKVLIGVGVFFGICILAAMCDDDSTSTVESSTESITEVPKKKEEQKCKWKYEENTDAMTDETAYFATLRSNNYTSFKFPYNNEDIYMTIVLRNSPQYGKDAYVRIPEGQFMQRIDDAKVMVRFDDAKAEPYRCSAPSDYSTETLFIKNSEKFINKLKESKQCRISAEFFDEGSHVFIFDCEGLVWEH